METIEQITGSSLFLPIVVGVMVVLILIFIIILAVGKKREKDEVKRALIKREENINNQEVASFEEEKIEEEVKTKEEVTQEQRLEQQNYVIDLPIPEMNDEEVGPPKVLNTESNEGEEVVITSQTQLDESNVPESEIVNLNINTNTVSDEVGEEVEAPEKQIQDTTPGDAAYNLESDNSRIHYPESGETANLSNVSTIGNKVADELSKIESTPSPDYFKTEVLDISEIKGEVNEIKNS